MVKNITAKTLQGFSIFGYAEDEIFSLIGKDDRFFEQSILDAWLPFAQQSKTILDVGANLGNHSIYFAAKTNASQIISFEPCKPSYDLLVHNISANSLSSRIHCVNMAIGSKKGLVCPARGVHLNQLGNVRYQYVCTAAEQDAVSDNNKLRDNDNTKEFHQVYATTLDDYIKENGINDIGFVKIDTEGFGWETIRGMQQIIERDKPGIWIELDPEEASPTAAFLEQHGYYLHDIKLMNCLFLHPDRFTDSRQLSTAILLERILKKTDEALDWQILYQKLNSSKENPEP